MLYYIEAFKMKYNFFLRKLIGLLNRVSGESYFTNKLSTYYINKNIKSIEQTIHPLIKKFANDLPDISSFQKIIENRIWILWWQGVEQAPDIVKVCIQSIKLENSESVITIVTKDNYKEFVELPDNIVQLFNNGVIPIQKFSNILRLSLLKEFGGIWIDATIFATKSINMKVNEDELLLFRRELSSTEFVRNGRYTTFFMGANILNDPLYEFVYQAHLIYWSKYNTSLDYFIFDYILEIAYKHNIGDCRNRVQSISNLSWDIFYLAKVINSPIKTSITNYILEDEAIWYKLSYKIKLNELENKRPTYYSELIKNNNFRMLNTE